ncbi:MAG: RNA polymerase sigma factor [Thermoleophilaceae bacterium]
MRDSDFERLFAEQATPLLAFLTYRTGDAALAEDVLADAFERVLRARARFDPRRASQKTWLYTIALNLLRDHARREGAEARALQGAAVRQTVPPSDDPMSHLDDRDQLSRALDVLSEEEREAVSLRFGADLEIADIARVLGVRRSTAHGRVYRALRRLREELG